VLITFYSPRNQTTSCQYKHSKQTSAAHYRGTLSLADDLVLKPYHSSLWINWRKVSLQITFYLVNYRIY